MTYAQQIDIRVAIQIRIDDLKERWEIAKDHLALIPDSDIWREDCNHWHTEMIDMIAAKKAFISES